MSSDSEAQTGWQNPAWVLGVMNFPRETVLLSRLREGTKNMLLRRNDLLEAMTQATKSGIVAGHVLAALYAFSESPWPIPEPSLSKAIHATARIAYQTKFADGSRMPRSETEVRKCFDVMRPVAHLWAAFRLHHEYPVGGPHKDLFRTEEGLHTLLRLARGVQSWALEWRAPRTHSRSPLIGESPWLVPDSIQSLYPSWAREPYWLLKTLAAYKRRPR